jgi:bifunctional DNA-binding transcriptional regulator/antitoxin component of YhaV-PrlF toxin-antitoxin module
MYIYFSIYYRVRWGEMPLIRKTHSIGRRIVLSIPSQLAEAYDISDGDELEIIPLGHGEFKVRKAQNLQGGAE